MAPNPQPTSNKIYDLNNTSEPFGYVQRYGLVDKISMLEGSQLKGIVPIVRPETLQNGEDNTRLEFDLYELSEQQCKQLHNYLEQCLYANNENKKQQESE